MKKVTVIITGTATKEALDDLHALGMNEEGAKNLEKDLEEQGLLLNPTVKIEIE